MDVLLDTCAFLYLCTDDPKLSKGAKGTILYRQNRRFLSIASVWEMAIKANPARNPKRKLELGKPIEVFMSEYMERYEVELIPIDMEYLAKVSVLQEEHGDPFERSCRALAAAAAFARSTSISSDSSAVSARMMTFSLLT